MPCVQSGKRRLESVMSPWVWVLIGLAVWLAPAMVAALALVWGIWRPLRAHPEPGLQAAEKPATTRQPLQEAELPQEGEPPREGDPPREGEPPPVGKPPSGI